MEKDITMGKDCLECHGTGFKADMSICQACFEELQSNMIGSYRGPTVPMQYQGIKFDKMFLPLSLHKPYGEFMEDLLKTIVSDYHIYQKNLLICSRPNSGKTVWAYNLIMMLSDKGYQIPTVLDLMTVREHLNYKSNDTELQNLVQRSRGLIVRLPAEMQFWMFSIMQSIIERRVAHNGFTVFLYSGKYSNLKAADRDDVLESILGAGSFHTIRLEDFS